MAGNINLGLPAQYVDTWFESGLAGAMTLAVTQQRQADTNLAYQFYSSVVMALQAIANEVPAVLPYGQEATVDYAFGLASLPTLTCVGHISDWATATINLPPLVAVGAMSDWAVGRASINLTATGVATG
jgi:hypothetical protein